MKAIILAAGKGSRLRPITDEIPKPLIKIGDTTILERIINNLPEEITEVICIVKHKKEILAEFLKSNNFTIPITCVEQTEGSGTMAALLTARPLLSSGERFLILNGDDIHTPEELTNYLQHNRSFGIQNMIMPGYHAVEADNGIVTGLRAATEEEKIHGTPVATGVYVLDTGIFNFESVVLRDGELGLPQTILAHTDTYPIHAVITTQWVPINSHEDLAKAREKFNQ